MFVLFVRHAHVTNSIFDNVVKDVIVVHEGHLFVLLGNLFEQDSSHGREISLGWFQFQLMSIDVYCSVMLDRQKKNEDKESASQTVKKRKKHLGRVCFGEMKEIPIHQKSNRTANLCIPQRFLRVKSCFRRAAPISSYRNRMEEPVSVLNSVLRRTQYTFYCEQFENSTRTPWSLTCCIGILG